MDSILGRSQFLSETANLFTDEKTANARARIVEWCNELPIVSANTKCELLAKIQETVLSLCLELLEEFLEPVLSLSHDQNSDVRKQVVSFIEQACKVKVDLLPQMINVISTLLRDNSAQVIKRVIQACGSIYRNGLQWICSQNEPTDGSERTWNVLCLVKAQILDMIDNENDGIRTNAIKFLEGVVVLESYSDEDSQKRENDFSIENVPENMKLIKRKKLEEEGQKIFGILMQFHAATHISSVNLIACMGSLCYIAKMRPCFMGAVVDSYTQLMSNFPPTLTDSQVSSVRKSLKMHLQALLKNRGSFEHQTTIRNLLLDLGLTQGEIQKLVPKMDKQEQQRRLKRMQETAASNLSKKMRLEEQRKQQMEIDEEELEKQRQKCTRVNEKFIAEHLRSPDVAVNLVLEFLTALPNEIPTHFLNEFSPIKDLTISQQIMTISRLLGRQMTEKRLGPGEAVFTKEPPMRPKRVVDPEQTIDIDENTTIKSNATNKELTEEQQRKEEASKKLRESMENAKNEQDVIDRMKERAKTLKLQEVTKPLLRAQKEKFQIDAIRRILNSERQCVHGGVASKRRKLVTVIAATFPDNARYLILDFILADIRQRIDLAFSWLYEEYCLLQGFTRHTYVKTENRPDYAYNELLTNLINSINQKCEYRDKIILFRRIYLEAPIITEEAITNLVQMCLTEEFLQHSLDLVRDLIILRPPRKNRVIRILLTFAVHERTDLRECSLKHLVTLYHVHNILPNRIDDFAVEWISYLEKEIPPDSIFSMDYGRPVAEEAWKEDTAKICLSLSLILLPYKPDVYLNKLCKIYVSTSPDLKRTILRSIDTCIKQLGVKNALLLKLIEDCPKGTETLFIRIIYILTEHIPAPDSELVRRVRDLYAHKVKDVRVLIPVLSGLTRQEIINALPKLIKLNPVVVKEVFNRLLCIGNDYANQIMPVTPTDVLVALHTIDLNACDLKCIVRATSLCLTEKDIFTQEVLIGVLQQLVEVVPIPTLLMRTIIQSLALYPRMSNFVLNLLQRLILKQVWRQKVIWDGFLKCIQRLKPQSLPIVLQLPAQPLVSALQQCPELRQPLLEYAESIQDEPMSGITQQILDIITGKSIDVFVTDESGGYITPDNIKKETEDQNDIGVINTVRVLTTSATVPVVAAVVSVSDVNQPLPPGED